MPARTDGGEDAIPAGQAAEVATWAASGAMAITGRPDAAPLGPPAGLVRKLQRIERRLSDRVAAMGGVGAIDAVALLGERAALAGLQRQGATSCGGATRLLRARDAWLAVSLLRPDDIELIPAWLELSAPIDDGWDAVVRAVRTSPAAEVVARGVLVGLPIALLAEAAPSAEAAQIDPAVLPVRAREAHGTGPQPRLDRPVVIDLSSLWAGPLCGSLLAAAGADVIKVESIRRPDGARRGSTAFFDVLNGGKRSVALDLQDAEGVRALVGLLADADVVIEASRPRALEQLGIQPSAMLAAGRVRVWTSITGHGRTGAGRDRVGFGDDAAVAGGLVSWDQHGPCFCADAVADPVAGLVAAVATLDKLHEGGRWLLDVSMAHVAAHLAGPTQPAASSLAVAAPRARPARGTAPALGQHNGAILHRVPPGDR